MTLLRFLAALTLAVGAAGAGAQTITFDGGDPIADGTFVISANGPNATTNFGVYPTNVFGWCAEDCGGLTTVTLRRADNAPFSISGMDAAALSNADGNPMVVTGNLTTGGVVVRNLTLSGTADMLTSYTLSGFDSVTSVTFTKNDTFGPGLSDGAVDNLVVGPGGFIAVPVMPLSMVGVMALGLLLLARRRLRLR